LRAIFDAMKRRNSVIFFMLFLIWNGVLAQVQNDSAIILTDTTELQVFYSNDTLFTSTDDSLRFVALTDPADSLLKVKTTKPLVAFLLRKDSLDVYTYSFFPDSVNYKNLQYLDTANHNSAQYNPVKKFDVSYNDLGPISSAQQNQIFSPSSQMGFQLGINSFNAFLWTKEDLRLYDNKSPYSRIFYLMGSKKENVLKVSHAQSFLNQQVTAQFDFQLYNHLGFYDRQHTDSKSFKGGMGYRTTNRRYSANFQYYHNKLVFEENGGIYDLLDFEEDRETNREIIDINLQNAENLVRISGISLSQDFYLSRPEPDLSQIPDTNIIEDDAYTVIHYKKPYFDPVSHFGKISYRFNYHRENFKYTDEDQDASLYDNIPVYIPDDGAFLYESLPYYPTADSSVIFDSITIRKYTNEILYSNSDYKDNAQNPKFLNFFAGIRNEFSYWNQACFDSKNMNHNAVIGGVFFSLSNFLSISGDAAYYVGDYLNNDFELHGKIYVRLKENKLKAGISIIHRSPDWIYQSFSSSRLRWNNAFGKTDQQILYLNFERKNLSLSAKVLNISNYLYFDELYQPRQEGKNIQHILIEARKDIRLANWGADFRVSYQNVSNPDVIRVPQFTGKTRLFYHNILFNNVLDMELGIEAYYFTSYYADRYFSLIRSYHIQNVQSIGEFPFMDVYFNAKIGKARLFVRYDNFSALFLDNTYYSSPGYPGLDPMFRFGVSWILFN
jgi:hypothetical protein